MEEKDLVKVSKSLWNIMGMEAHASYKWKVVNVIKNIIL